MIIGTVKREGTIRDQDLVAKASMRALLAEVQDSPEYVVMRCNDRMLWEYGKRSTFVACEEEAAHRNAP